MGMTNLMTRNTHFVFNNIFPPENRSVYEITRKNIVQRVRPQMTIWHMRILCWILKATNTYTQGCVIVMVFALQLLLHERASKVRYKYVVCLYILRNFYATPIVHVTLPEDKTHTLTSNFSFYKNRVHK